MKAILKRRSAKYVRGGFRVCYLCQYNKPEIIHHTSYFPEETVAVCSTCHNDIHTDGVDTGLEPPHPRPDDYEKQRRRQESNGVGHVKWFSEENPVWEEVERGNKDYGKQRGEDA